MANECIMLDIKTVWKENFGKKREKIYKNIRNPHITIIFFFLKILTNNELSCVFFFPNTSYVIRQS